MVTVGGEIVKKGGDASLFNVKKIILKSILFYILIFLCKLPIKPKAIDYEKNIIPSCCCRDFICM